MPDEEQEGYTFNNIMLGKKSHSLQLFEGRVLHQQKAPQNSNLRQFQANESHIDLK